MSFDPNKSGDPEEVLRNLTCLRPGTLDEFHPTLVSLRIFNPPVIYQGGSADVGARILDELPGENPDHLLLALAWIGGDGVQDAFRGWREDPPGWATELHIPPHRYAEQAGWEPTGDGTRRDLFVRTCHPLVQPGDRVRDASIARVVADHEGTCRWCGRRMTTMIDLNLASPALSYLRLGGRRLRIATCDVCTCYGTVFTDIDLDGASSWHEGNRKPGFLPDGTADWPRMRPGSLGFGDEPRPWLEAADWLVPGVRFSQVGGYPTWVQDAEYPHCPRCDWAMPFVAQISNGDWDEYAKGIYHMFVCRDCGVAATSYQQS